MPAELAAAVMAGGDVPDLMQGSDSNMQALYDNGVLEDLSEWAQAQSWYADMDPNALKACTIDGGLYCLPIAEVPYVTFVWNDLFPNGYPTTPEEFEAEAERLKAEGINIWTYFGSTDFDGAGAIRATWTTIAGFGGAYDDGQGNMKLNTPENIAAIEFLRKAAQEGWTTEVSFAGGFQEEEAFKDASAASIPTGLFGYRYIRPLKAPNGNEYTTETEAGHAGRHRGRRRLAGALYRRQWQQAGLRSGRLGTDHARGGQEPRGRLRLYQLADDGARAERRLGHPRCGRHPVADNDL